MFFLKNLISHFFPNKDLALQLNLLWEPVQQF